MIFNLNERKITVNESPVTKKYLSKNFKLQTANCSFQINSDDFMPILFCAIIFIIMSFLVNVEHLSKISMGKRFFLKDFIRN